MRNFIVILFGLLATFNWNAFAQECSVNDRSMIPWSMELDAKFEACRERNGQKQCAEQSALNFGKMAVGMNLATGTCGAKSSEFVLNGNKLEGTFVICKKDTESGRYTLKDTLCEQRKS